MTRILFVDDEQRVLDGLRRTLRSHRDRWQMTFALGGEAALQELERAPFDVIVSDMRMPQLDGLALLTAVRDRWPRTARIVLSGYMEMEVAIRSAAVAHQFLTKPCDPAVLEDVVDRTCRVTGLLADEALRTAVGEIGALATTPKVYAELNGVIANQDAGMGDVTRIIERDVSLTAKVLQLVNSSSFELPQHVGTVEQAVASLGLNVIRALVLSEEIAELASARTLAPGFSLVAHQEHALRVANVARKIMGGGPAADDAFLAGVLHDVGKLLIAMQRPEWFAAATTRAAEGQLPLHEAERELFGVSHAEVGAYLVGLWGLPFQIVEAIAQHHAPSTPRTGAVDLPGAIHVADVLVREDAPPDGMSGVPPKLDGRYLNAAVEAQLAGWRAAAAR